MAYIDSNNVAYSDDRKVLTKCPASFSGHLVIPEGTTQIGAGAFKDCVKLSSLTIPSSLTTIGANAYSGCKTLTNIYYDGTLSRWLNNLTCYAYAEVGYDLWIKNPQSVPPSYDKITKITLPEDVNEIRDGAFYYCKSLSFVIFHKHVNRIGNDAFNKSGYSSSLWIPEGCTHVGRYAFFNCLKLGNINLPESLAFIGEGCFACCYALYRFDINPDNSNFSIGGEGKLLYDKFQTKLYACASIPGTSTRLRISKTCKEFADAAFRGAGAYDIFLSDISSAAKNIKDCKCHFHVPYGSKAKFVANGFPKDQVLEQYDPEHLLKGQKDSLDIIAHNPFRILGVLSNAPAKEISANATKIKRFSAAGKAVSYPYDFNFSLQEVLRTPKSVDQALSQINLPQDKIKHALFWPLASSEHEKEALACLSKNDFVGYFQTITDSVEGDNETNLDIIDSFKYAIDGKKHYGRFITSLLKIIKKEGAAEYLIDQVCGNVLSYSSKELSDLFIDTLYEECDPNQLYLLLSDSVYGKEEAEHLKDLILGRYISIINNEISIARSVDKNDAQANYDAANRLIEKTKDSLQSVREFLPENDAQYELLADSLAKQILQSGINYYNSSKTTDVASAAYKIQSYALSIAVGKLAKERCEQNTRILKGILESTPPAACVEIDNEINAILESKKIDTVEEAVTVLESLAPYIVKLKTVRDKASWSKEENEHFNGYLKNVSTEIGATVLNRTIDILNDILKNKQGFVVSVYIDKAWKVMCYIGSLDLDRDFRESRFSPNNNTLRELYLKTRVNDAAHMIGLRDYAPTYSLDLKTEKDLYRLCVPPILSEGIKAIYAKDPTKKLQADRKRESLCDEYISKYPCGEFIDTVRGLKEDLEWQRITDISGYRSYAIKYPAGKYLAQARAKIDDYEKTQSELRGLDTREKLAEAHKKYEGTIYDEIIDNAYYERCRNKAHCQEYMAIFKNGKHYSEASKRANKEHTNLCVILGVLVTGLIGGWIGYRQGDFWTGFAIGTLGNCVIPVCILPGALFMWLIDGTGKIKKK